MGHRVTLLPGDGIGPEVTEAARAVIDATGVAIEWEVREAGLPAIEREGEPLPASVLAAIRETGTALKGPVTTPIGGGFQSVNVRLRKALDLYASVRPVRTLPGVATRYEHVDLVIIRENTEGLYAGLEHEVVPGVIETLKIVTEAACLRIAEFAFALARRDGRRKVTAAHKASVMRMTDGLFLDCCRAVAARYPEVGYEEMAVDTLCMQLVLDPTRFDVVLLENLYGDIVSDLGAGLVGGLGVVPGANIGTAAAVFEAVHGSAPDIAGRNLANPLALILSGALMLEHLGEPAAAQRIVAATTAVLAEGRVRTRDLGGRAGTTDVRDAIVAALAGGRV
ncbi:MAG: isocitrate dehydrogenase [Polyangiaceae bacterium UTPRO1]|jgi:isocitrate dehydrogenase (NAD+)|nr:isocitrate/isopropylmalate dehydrogenase family protein [Myxococcales bacterium]OQY67767.1 MAG: isocitrate dehydrogenase [Polyangiaceae bacterium UTPRO1]